MPASDTRTAHGSCLAAGGIALSLAFVIFEEIREGRACRWSTGEDARLSTKPGRAQFRFFSHGGELCCIQQRGDDKKTFAVQK